MGFGGFCINLAESGGGEKTGIRRAIRQKVEKSGNESSSLLLEGNYPEFPDSSKRGLIKAFGDFRGNLTVWVKRRGQERSFLKFRNRKLNGKRITEFARSKYLYLKA